jgi:hypothetical protein
MGIQLDSGTKTAGDSEAKKGSADDTSFTCPLSSECTPTESCKAKCYNKASCDAITGKDSAKAADLTACLTKCETTAKGDSKITPPADGGPDDSEPPKPDQEVDSCVPSCNEKECGPDGCGGSCGTCTSPKVCDTSQGLCVTTCTPSCSGKQCGDDGCGGSCGTCSSGYYCDGYQCKKTCTPSCSGKQCGSDGCGGSCGTCSTGYICDSYGKCISTCTPSCSGKQCGDDGCGGSCGTCSSGYTCDASGQCKAAGVCAWQKDYQFSTGTMESFTETHTDTKVMWQPVSNRYHTPSYAIRYGDPTANNFTGSGTNSGKLYLPQLTIPTTGTSTLKFWLYMDTETGTSYDTLTVTHSAVTTTLWTKSTNVTMKQWKEHTVDLSSLAGKSGQITFNFATVDGSGNTGEGVYIDDVSVSLGCQ